MEELDSFMKRLASGSPAPGGGAASALVSVVASSLASMVSSLTMDKKGYESERERMVEVQEIAKKTSNKLRQLMADDESAFNLIVSAWGLPKTTDEEKGKRKAEIEKATMEAIKVPMNIARESLIVLNLASYLAAKGNKNAITDSACASEFAMSAIRGSLYNAMVNLKSISDVGTKTELDMKIRMIMEAGSDIYEANSKIVKSKLS